MSTQAALAAARKAQPMGQEQEFGQHAPESLEPSPLFQDKAVLCLLSLSLLGFASSYGLLLGGEVLDALQLKRMGLNVFDSLMLDSRVFIGQWWRAITYMFVHVNLGHLVGNLIVLLPVLSVLRRWTKSHVWLMSFAIGGLVGGMAELLAQPTQSIAGASGGIAALCGLTITCACRLLASGRKAPGALFALVVLVWFIFNHIAAAIGSSGNIAHMAHFTGLVSGLIFGRWASLPTPNPENSNP